MDLAVHQNCFSLAQKMKVVPVEKKMYGKFYSGDSYIVLQVRVHCCSEVCISYLLVSNHYVACCMHLLTIESTVY